MSALCRKMDFLKGLPQFQITDTGCGLTQEQQERLFQPFSQVDSSATRKYGGTGLGLTLARRLAEALGGKNSVNTKHLCHWTYFCHYSVVLMDMQMPILDGYDASKQLRAQGYETPIVALTGNAMRGERETCIASGCIDYLRKPVKASTLIEVVERHVKKRLN